MADLRGARRRRALLLRRRPAPDVRAAHRRAVPAPDVAAARSCSRDNGVRQLVAGRRHVPAGARAVQRQPRDPAALPVRSRAGHRRTTIARLARRWAGDELRAGAADGLDAGRGGDPGVPEHLARSTRPSASRGTGSGRGRSCRTSRPSRASERAYYEDFMCTTPHNPNNVDLSRDVLFHADRRRRRAALDVERIDAGVWPPLDQAIALLESRRAPRPRTALGPANVIADQLVRLRALRCWLMTQRNVAAWVAGVYGWMERRRRAPRRRRWRARARRHDRAGRSPTAAT